MGRRFSPLSFAFFALVFGSLMVFPSITSAAQQKKLEPPRGAQEREVMIELAPSGLPTDTQPENLLPAGAIMHVRINGGGAMLDDASKMLTPFIPEEAIGPPALVALEESNPVLALIGLQMMGQPLSIELLEQITGIDSKRPITLSFYMDAPDRGFVFCLPVFDLDRAAAMLQNMDPNIASKKIELEGGSAWHVQSPAFEMFVVCSEDMVCVCGSPQLAQNLLSAPTQPKLNTDKLFTQAIEKHTSDNLVLVIDPTPLKIFLPMLESFGTVPPEQIAEFRNEFLANFGPADLEEFNHQIRSNLGVRDIDQLFDYIESIGMGSYEVTFEYLFESLKGFNGVTFAIDLQEEFQSFEMSVFSDSIKAENSIQPLPLADVRKTVKSVPGPHNFLVLSGRSAEPKKSTYLAALVNRVGKKMTEKNLPMTLHENVQAAIDGYEPVKPLKSKVDWTIDTHFMLDAVDPELYEDTWTYFSDAWASFYVFSLQAIPLQEEGFLESHFNEKSKTTNANYANWRKLWQSVDDSEAFYEQYSDSRAEELENGVNRLTYEDCYKTTSGFFGYNEHVLINRYFTLYRNQPDHTLLWLGGNDPARFLSFKPQPEAPAIDRLFDSSQIPKDTQRIEVMRNVHGILGIVDTVEGIETVLHKEMEAYRTKIQQLGLKADNENDWIELIPKIRAIPMPFSVAHVAWDPDSNQIYLVTPTGLTYPRPKVIPAVQELMKDYRSMSKSLGGALIHHRTQTGKYDLVVTQSTAGIAALVRSVGNNVAKEYLNNPNGQERLEQLLSTELDRNPERGYRLLSNDDWWFLGY